MGRSIHYFNTSHGFTLRHTAENKWTICSNTVHTKETSITLNLFTNREHPCHLPFRTDGHTVTARNRQSYHYQHQVIAGKPTVTTRKHQSTHHQHSVIAGEPTNTARISKYHHYQHQVIARKNPFGHQS